VHVTRRLGTRIALVFALAAGSAGPAAGDPPAGETSLLRTDVAAVQPADLVALLAPERGTRINPQAPPTIQLPVLFEFGTVDLLPDSVAWLEKVSTALASPDLQPFRFRVEGHTDSWGEPGSNERLSIARAEAVKAFVVARGIAPARIETVGRGESDPIDSNETPEGRQHNRRVEFANLGPR
jgi:outer membrane protein OmpA-like peptidoglycan-associated protein